MESRSLETRAVEKIRVRVVGQDSWPASRAEYHETAGLLFILVGQEDPVQAEIIVDGGILLAIRPDGELHSIESIWPASSWRSADVTIPTDSIVGRLVFVDVDERTEQLEMDLDQSFVFVNPQNKVYIQLKESKSEDRLGVRMSQHLIADVADGELCGLWVLDYDLVS